MKTQPWRMTLWTWVQGGGKEKERKVLVTSRVSCVSYTTEKSEINEKNNMETYTLQYVK